MYRASSSRKNSPMSHVCSYALLLRFYTSWNRKPKARRGHPPKIGIARFSSESLMIPQITSTTLEGVLTEMCQKLEDENFVENSDTLINEALKREAIVSTAVEHGLAFPHVRGVEGGGLSFVLGLSKKGIKFGGSPKTLTRIIFFVVIPTAASAFYLKLLSGLSETFRSKEARDKVFGAKTPKDLWKTLVKITKTTVR
ncbi:MAG: hypothetical protein GKR87_16720 [Kiritimatiellae bacterium]|nr:hypothetical protein [Kiritimatiellia bacterium]NKB25977.1 hypothetical protein [Kiritimatiellia bacterium]